MRRPTMARVAAAVAVFLTTAARARSRRVGPVEERIFRRVNDAPDAVHPPVWLVMQAGSLAAVFVAAGAVHRRRGWRSAATVAATGTGVWAAVKAVKPLIGRGRPEDHLAHVSVRGLEQDGLGFPSGHAAVSLTLAYLLSRRSTLARGAGLAVALVTGWARVYVGAHLPLDVVGGYAAGMAVGALADGYRARGNA